MKTKQWVGWTLLVLCYCLSGCRSKTARPKLRVSSWKLQKARFWTASQPPMLITLWKRHISGSGLATYEHSLRGFRLSDGGLVWSKTLGRGGHPDFQSLYHPGVLRLRQHLWLKGQHPQLLHIPSGRVVVSLTPELVERWLPAQKGRFRVVTSLRGKKSLRRPKVMGFVAFVDTKYATTWRFHVLTGKAQKVQHPASRYLHGQWNQVNDPALSSPWPKRCLSTDWFAGYRQKAPIPSDWPQMKVLTQKHSLFRPTFLQTICSKEKTHPILVQYQPHLDAPDRTFARFDKKGGRLWRKTFPTLRRAKMVYWKGRLLVLSRPAYYHKTRPFLGALDVNTGRWHWKQVWKK